MSIIEKIKILLESPDHAEEDNGRYHRPSDPDAFAIALHKGKFYIGKEKSTHAMLVNKTPELNTEYQGEIAELRSKGNVKAMYFEPRTMLDYPGRVWTREGIISFWRYPNKLDFKKVLEKLKSEFGNMVDNWQVEVFDGEGPDDDVDAVGKLIPVSEYSEKGDKELKNADKPHVMSPIEKEKLKKQGKLSRNGGPVKKLPKGMTLAQYHNITKKESVEI